MSGILPWRGGALELLSVVIESASSIMRIAFHLYTSPKAIRNLLSGLGSLATYALFFHRLGVVLYKKSLLQLRETLCKYASVIDAQRNF